MGRRASELLVFSGSRKRREGLGMEASRGSRVAWSAQNLPDSGVLSRPCPRKLLFVSPTCVQPSGFTRKCHQASHTLWVCRADHHPVCRWGVSAQRGQAASLDTAVSHLKPSALWKLQLFLLILRHMYPCFLHFKVSKIGLCLTNDANKTFRPSWTVSP